MGPITLFDKSFLQSLNVDESVWFDHFFYSVICPIFYIETLADLEKAIRQGRTPEQEVGYIADQSPEFHRNHCGHHRTLCMGNLMSHNVPMNGQIPVTGGHYVKTDEGKKGLVFEHSQEAQALSRRIQKSWLSFCVMAIIVTNSVCWARFQRASIGKYRVAALTWMFRKSEIPWELLFQMSVTVILQRYGITEGNIGIDDTDKKRSKLTKKIFHAVNTQSPF